MADAIVRLKIESQEYDGKIKRAQEGLTRYADECRKCGGTLEYVEKETLEYVRSLGQMETVAKTTKGKIAELKNAYQELGVQYKQLTAAEKNSPYGQALQGSLQQLKGRFTELSGKLNETNTELGYNGFSGILDKISGKLGIPTNLLKEFGVAGVAVASAAKLASEALKVNETYVDDWGRATKAAGSIYEGFLKTLNTGDFSGYFANMSKIREEARKAYDAMDELGTFNAFNQNNLSQAQANYSQSVADFKGGKGSADAVKSAFEKVKDNLELRQKKELDRYTTEINRVAAVNNVSGDRLRGVLEGDYSEYQRIKGLSMPTKSIYNSSTRSFVDEVDYGAATEEQRLGEALRNLNDTQLKDIQALKETANQTAKEIADLERSTYRMLGSAAKGTQAPAGMLNGQKATVNALQEQWDNAGVDGATSKLWNDLDEGKRKLEEMEQAAAQLGQTLQSSFSVQAPANLNDELGKVHMTTRAVGTDSAVTAQGTGKAWSAAATAVATVGSALQQIEDPAAKVAGIVAVAIAQVAAGLGQMLAMPQSTAQSWGWIALAATGTATMIATITAIKSATSGYAEGGMILPNGNPYGGDNIVARLNAGEGVLTQRGIATAEAMSQVQGAGLQAIQVHIAGRISGRELRMVMDNDNRAMGGTRGLYARTH